MKMILFRRFRQRRRRTERVTEKSTTTTTTNTGSSSSNNHKNKIRQFLSFQKILSKSTITKSNTTSTTISTNASSSNIFRPVNTTISFQTIPDLPTISTSSSSSCDDDDVVVDHDNTDQCQTINDLQHQNHDDNDLDNNEDVKLKTTLSTSTLSTLVENILKDHHQDNNLELYSSEQLLQQEQEQPIEMVNNTSQTNSVPSILNDHGCYELEQYMDDTTDDDDDIDNDDDLLFTTQVELAFTKETCMELENELQYKERIINQQQLESCIGHKVLQYTYNELQRTKESFHNSVVTVVEQKITILSLQEQLRMMMMHNNHNLSLVQQQQERNDDDNTSYTEQPSTTLSLVLSSSSLPSSSPDTNHTPKLKYHYREFQKI